MTGGQENPGTGKTLLGEPSKSVDLEALVRSLGIKRVQTIDDPFDLALVEKVIREEMEAEEASVVITKYPCVLQFKIKRPIYQVDPELCIGCKHCLKAGCMALNLTVDASGDRKVEIDPAQCNGCGICAQLCKEDAINRPAPAEGGKA